MAFALNLDHDAAAQHDEAFIALMVQMWARIGPRLIGVVVPDLETRRAEAGSIGWHATGEQSGMIGERAMVPAGMGDDLGADHADVALATAAQ